MQRFLVFVALLFNREQCPCCVCPKGGGIEAFDLCNTTHISSLPRDVEIVRKRITTLWKAVDEQVLCRVGRCLIVVDTILLLVRGNEIGRLCACGKRICNVYVAERARGCEG